MEELKNRILNKKLKEVVKAHKGKVTLVRKSGKVLIEPDYYVSEKLRRGSVSGRFFFDVEVCYENAKKTYDELCELDELLKGI